MHAPRFVAVAVNVSDGIGCMKNKNVFCNTVCVYYLRKALGPLAAAAAVM